MNLYFNFTRKERFRWSI